MSLFLFKVTTYRLNVKIVAVSHNAARPLFIFFYKIDYFIANAA